MVQNDRWHNGMTGENWSGEVTEPLKQRKKEKGQAKSHSRIRSSKDNDKQNVRSKANNRALIVALIFVTFFTSTKVGWSAVSNCYAGADGNLSIKARERLGKVVKDNLHVRIGLPSIEDRY